MGYDSATLGVPHGSGGDTQTPKRASERSMRADGVYSANAGAGEKESKPPAFQIIVLVRKYRVSGIHCPSLQMSRHHSCNLPLAWAVV